MAELESATFPTSALDLGSHTQSRCRARAKMFSLAFCLLCLLGASSWAGIDWYQTVWNVPRLEIEQTDINLGIGSPNQVLNGQVRFKNSGNRVLEFELFPSCGCTSLSPKKGVIAPGLSAAADVAITLSSTPGSTRSVTIRISSNDPRSPDAACFVSAKCPALVVATPSVVDFGSIRAGEPKTLEREIALTSEKEAIGALFPRLEIVQRNARLPIRSTFFTTDTESRVSLRLQIIDPAQLEIGEYTDSLSLRAIGKAEVTEIPVRVRVVNALSVVPSTVFLLRDKSAVVYRPFDIIVVLTSNERDDRLGNVRLLDTPAGVVIEDLGSLGPKRRRIRATVDPQYLKDSDQCLTFECEGYGTASVVLRTPHDARHDKDSSAAGGAR